MFKRYKYSYDENDYEFMQSLSSAILEQTPKSMSRVIFLWLITIALAIYWASIAQIDEIVRGSGEIVPSGNNQIIQNLEGGIVKEILIQEGDLVEKNQVLLSIGNLKSTATLETNRIKSIELEAKIIRLNAEANNSEFTVSEQQLQQMPKLIAREKSLFITALSQFESQNRILQEQLNQKENELQETRIKLKYLKVARRLIKEEVKMTAPMVKKGVKSKVEFLKLQREVSVIEERYQSLKVSIPRLQSAIKEAQDKLSEPLYNLQRKAKKELNEVISEFDRINASKKVLQDQVSRTLVRSPINGTIQMLNVHTVGGVIKPGQDLIEIVPSDDVLWVEAKIKPADIAFIYPEQAVMVKFSAYDFAIYGGLDGEVVLISADTTTDKNEDTFYTVHIKTKNNYLGSDSNKLKIISGMTVNVDILTGKKTVLDYILKPILRAKQYTFTER
jgi:membrane fusion protein, adhesin transport system